MSRRNYPKHSRRSRTKSGMFVRVRARPARTKCGKVGYRDKAEALRWRDILAGSKVRNDDGKKQEKRVFPCHICRNVWHITSQDAEWEGGRWWL